MNLKVERFILRATQKVFDSNTLKRPTQIETTQEEIQLYEWFVDLVEPLRPGLTSYVFIHPVTFLLVMVNASNIEHATELFGKRLPAFLLRLGIESEFFEGKIPTSDNAMLLPTNNSEILARWRALKVVLQNYASNFLKDHLSQIGSVDYEIMKTAVEDRMTTYPIQFKGKEILSAGRKMELYLKMVPAPVSIVQGIRCKVILKDVEPPVSRIFQLSAQSTFYDLHHVLQAVMGWQNSHLFEFKVSGKVIYLPELNEHGSDWHELYDVQPLNVRNVRLTDVVSKPAKRFTYLYDYGDSWEHEVTVLEFIQVPENSLPLCLSGTGGDVPEDCGGSSGLSELLEVMSDPNNESYKEYKSWLGKTDPFTFDLQKINLRLRHLKKKIKQFERNLLS